MKTTNLILLAAAMAIATIGFAQSESSPACADKAAPTFSAKISVKVAMQNPNLLKAMYAQLNPGFLSVEKQVYVVPVKVKASTYYIAGTYNEWSLFFSIKPKSGPAK